MTDLAPHRALRVLASPPGATWRVVVCPHAGGAASWFRRFVVPGAQAPEVVAVQYPGRETRFGEPPALTMTDLLADVAGPVRALLADAVPTVLLGHSLGASVAVRIAAGLSPADGPDLLVVSGRAASADHPAGLSTGRPRQAGVPGEAGDVVGPGTAPAVRDDAALRAWVAALGGTPPELLADDGFFALHARVLRADLAVHDSIAEHDALGSAPDVRVPLLLLAGSDDVAAPPAAVEPWAERARAGARLHVLDGGHFAVGERPDEVLDVLRDALASASAGSHAAGSRAVTSGAAR